MENNLSTWHEFWETFRLPIFMSLIGAVIGHYRKNGVIQMPIIVIAFEPGHRFKKYPWYLKPLRWIYVIIDFLLFFLGLRHRRSLEEKGIWADLGFLGDLLIGVGTGILAKCGLAVIESPSIFVEISTSLLAGFAGLSYLLSKQKEDFGIQADEAANQSYSVNPDSNIQVNKLVAAGQEGTVVTPEEYDWEPHGSKGQK